MRALFLMTLISIVLSGCLTTSITATRNESIPQRHYEKIFMDPFSKQEDKYSHMGLWGWSSSEISCAIEAEITLLLRARNIDVLSLAEMFPDETKPGQEDIDRLVEEFAPDAIFYVVHTTTGSRQVERNVMDSKMVYVKPDEKRSSTYVFVPGTSVGTPYYTGRTKGGLDAYSVTYTRKETSLVHTTTCDFSILDNELKEAAWTAQTSTGDSMEQNLQKATQRIAAKVVEQLVKDNVIP